MFLYLTQGLVLGAAAAAQPGPFQAFLLSLVLRGGWRGALPAAFAPLISDGPIIALVLLVLTQLPPVFLSLLQIGGGLFLLYLGWSAYKGSRTDRTTAPAAASVTTRTVGQAALMNFLSPAPYIFWATIAGPILIEGWRNSPALGLAFLAGFYIALIGGLMLLVFLFTAMGSVNPRVTRALALGSAVALGLFGLYQLGQGLLAVQAELL